MSESFDRKPKRFTLSNESFAQERISGLRAAFEAVKSRYPEVLSFALYGSLVKGTTREDSDIDFSVYLDADLLEHNRTESGSFLVDRKWDFNVSRNNRAEAVTFRWKGLRKDVEDEYIGFIRSTIKQQLPELEDLQLRHINTYPVSREILDEVLNSILASYREYPTGVEGTRIYLLRPPILEGESAEEITEDSRVEPDHVLYSLFFLDLGGGLRPYRAHVIDKLMEEGETGEQVWKDLIHSTEAWEQRVSFYGEPTDKRYPRTLAEAKELYGAEIQEGRSKIRS